MSEGICMLTICSTRYEFCADAYAQVSGLVNWTGMLTNFKQEIKTEIWRSWHCKKERGSHKKRFRSVDNIVDRQARNVTRECNGAAKARSANTKTKFYLIHSKIFVENRPRKWIRQARKHAYLYHSVDQVPENRSERVNPAGFLRTDTLELLLL
jgi:hypothetical protein